MLVRKWRFLCFLSCFSFSELSSPLFLLFLVVFSNYINTIFVVCVVRCSVWERQNYGVRGFYCSFASDDGEPGEILIKCVFVVLLTSKLRHVHDQ